MTMPSPGPAFPRPGHDHRQCVYAALARAEAVCAASGLRLTAGRRQVLEVVAQSHRAIGAYQIIEEMGRAGAQPAPMTVYRALDFLLAAGLVHKIESLNAYVGCQATHEGRPAVLFICRTCGTVGEVDDTAIGEAIEQGAAGIGFTVESSLVEVAGECVHCRGDA